MPPVAQGLFVLAISLATAGAIATSSDWSPQTDDSTASALPGVAALPLASVSTGDGPASEVPLRSGRLIDDVVVEPVQPVAIRVAGIALEATIISVGVDDNDQFDVPAADTVGWYQHSASPGEAGASVLAAHVDYGGAPGAFFNLAEVLPGDRLELEMEDGRVMEFVVTGNTEYSKTELPFDELFRKEGESVLQLITCGGTFDPEARSYEANVVVTAVPVGA